MTLNNQTPAGDDPMSPRNLALAEAARREREAAEETTRRKRFVNKETEPGFKVPYSAIWKAWSLFRPHVIPYLGAAGVSVAILHGGAAAEPPKAAPVIVDDRRVEKVETALADHLRVDAERRAEDNERWRRTDQTLRDINKYLLEHAGK